MDMKYYYYLSILSKIMTFIAKMWNFVIKRNLKSELDIKVNSLRKRQGRKKIGECIPSNASLQLIILSNADIMVQNV